MADEFHSSLQKKAAKIAGCLREAFRPPEPYAYFIQCGSGFECRELFREEPEKLLLGEAFGEQKLPHPDGLEPVFLSGCNEQGVPLLVLQGHRHLCEGYGTEPCLAPVAAAVLMGIAHHVYVESAISLHPEIKTGTWTILTDFINEHAVSPLDGQLHWLADPYPDLNEALSQEQNAHIINNLDQVGIHPRLCTYLSIPGHHLCTPAEAVKAAPHAQMLGHDLVMELILSYALGCTTSACALAAGQFIEGKRRRILRKEVLETCGYCSPVFMRGLSLACAEHYSYRKNPVMPVLPEAQADDILQRSITIKADRPLKLKLKRSPEN